MIILISLICFPLFAVIGIPSSENISHWIRWSRTKIEQLTRQGKALAGNSQETDHPHQDAMHFPTGHPIQAEFSQDHAPPAATELASVSLPQANLSQPENQSPLTNVSAEFAERGMQRADAADRLPTAGNGAISAEPFPAAADSNARIEEIKQQLRDLGATYFALENWGASGNLYRFHGRIAYGEDPNFQRFFQAIDNDPVQAMQKVLVQVQQWRATLATAPRESLY